MVVKGIVLTLDSIIAMLLMISIISLLIFFRIESISPFLTAQQLHSLSEDSLNILSKSTLREVTNQTLLDDLNQSGILNENYWNDKAINVIGMLWAENNASSSSAAAEITKDILGNILPNNVGYQLLVEDDNIYLSDTPSESTSEAGISSGRIASGYESNKTVSGCVAMAYVTSIKGKKDSSYVYLGGYVGDGNITTNITLPSFDKILEAYMEMNDGSNFTLYINGNYSGNYSNGTAGGGSMRADKWVVCKDSNYNPYYEPDVNVANRNCSNFTEGNNTINFNFTGNNSFIGGGYFRVTYNTTQLAPTEQIGKDIYWFPGISGFFNLYDSFYVPGTLTNMTSYLHYFNNVTLNATAYLTIGNVKVFRSNVTGEQKINLSYSDIWQNFTSQQNLINNVSNKTVPIRFGVEGFEMKPGVGTADAILITDVSGSMTECDVESPPPSNVTPDCNGIVGVQNRRIDIAKNVDKTFVDTVLGTSGNRVGLVSYRSTLSNTHPLSNNSVALKGNISAYTASASTCMSCGILNATRTLDTVSEPRFKGMLVMSDGIANQCLNGDWCGIYGGSVNGNYDGLDPVYPAKLEALNKSCEARSKNYTVFSVGFSNSADNFTLQRIACWNCSVCRVLNCEQVYTQGSCEAAPDCYWNATAIVNNTVFYDDFETWSTGSDCSFAPTNFTPSNNWNTCLDTDNSRIRGQSTSEFGSYALRTAYWNDLFPGSEALIKCVDLTPYSKAYLTFWWMKSGLDAGEYGRIDINSGSGWVNIWDSGTGSSSDFEERQINITDYKSSNTCIGIRQKSSSTNEWVNYDRFEILGTVIGGCKNNFSSSSPCWIGNVTLPNGTQADCRAVRYAQSSNVNELTQIYQGFGQWFVHLGYTTQKANISSNAKINNVLYSDSYIELQYSPLIIPYEYGEISLTIETPRLKNLTGDTIDKPYKEGWFNTSDKVKVVNAKITSYSSDNWTDMLWINSSATGIWKEVYNLTKYGSDYTGLGDPFIIHIPVNDISSGNNSMRIETGISPNITEKSGGSPDDRVIYTIRVKGAVGYGGINETCDGAINEAYHRLNESIGGYVSFTNNEILFQNNTIKKVPYMWGPSIIRVRVWS
jgi:hypothetical protein